MDLPTLIKALQANFDALSGVSSQLQGSYQEQSSSIMRVKEESSLALDLSRIEQEGDGAPPGSSPTPVVAGGVGFIAVSWAPMLNSSTVTYDVHISTTTGFTPDGTTLVGQMPAAGMYFIRKMPGGVDDLAYDTDYYIKLVARDVDGSAAASAEATTRLVPADGPDIALNGIIAGHILAGTIRSEHLAAVLVVGNTIQTFPDGPVPTQGVRISGESGLTAYNANGDIVVSLPTTGDDFSFVGVIEALGIDVVGDAMFRSLATIDQGAAIVLNQKVSDPTTNPPSLVQEVPALATANIGTNFDAAYPWFDGTNVWMTRFQDESQPEVVKWDATMSTEVAAQSPVMPSIGPWANIFVVRHSGQWIGLARRLSDNDMRWLVWDDDGEGGCPMTLLAHGGYFQDEADLGLSSDCSLTYDGTKLYVLQQKADESEGLIKVFTPVASAVPTYDGAGSMVTITTAMFNVHNDPVPFIRSDADFGATRFILRMLIGNTSKYETYNTSGTIQTNEWWEAAEVAVSRGFWYNAGFFELKSTATGLWDYTGWVWTTESTKYWVKYSWSDNTNESAGSPTSSITMKKRRQLTLTTPELPAGITEVRIYMDRNATEPTLDHQVDSASKTVVLTSFTAGGAAPLTVSTLPDATAAELRTSDGVALIRADGLVRCKLTYAANPSLNNNVDYYIRFGTEVTDTGGFHAATTDQVAQTPNSTYDLVMPFTGQYLVTLGVQFAVNGTGRRDFWFEMDAVGERLTRQSVATVSFRDSAQLVMDANQGSILRLATRQTSGGVLTLEGAKVSVIFIGPT